MLVFDWKYRLLKTELQEVDIIPVTLNKKERVEQCWPRTFYYWLVRLIIFTSSILSRNFEIDYLNQKWIRIIFSNFIFLLNHTIGLVLVAQLGASTENDKNSYNESPLRDDGIPAAESSATSGTLIIPLWRNFHS